MQRNPLFATVVSASGGFHRPKTAAPVMHEGGGR